MSIMDSIGIEYSDPIPRSVSVVVSTNRPEHLSNVLETHAAQKLENRELIIVQHGFGSSPEMLNHAADLGIENLVLT